MFKVNDDLSIYATRGDAVFFSVMADTDGVEYIFKADEVVRVKIFSKKNCEDVVMQKDFAVTENTDRVDILLTEDDTKFGDVISKPTDYWYEIELNPFTNPQTIIGYDEDGAKVFKLFPEGKDITTDIDEEEIPVVDEELSLTSERPVQNQAVTRGFIEIRNEIKGQIVSAVEDVTKPVLDECRDAASGVITIEQNNQRPLYFWVGTSAEYNALPKKDTHCIYVLTDDTSEEELAALLETLQKDVEAVQEQCNNIAVEDTTHKGCFYRMVDGVKEWINPPYEWGVEYATTKRYNGERVYTKLFRLGYLPNTDYMSIRVGSDCDKVTRYEITIKRDTATSTVTLPFFDANGAVCVRSYCQNDCVYIQTFNSEMAAYVGFCTAEYIK